MATPARADERPYGERSRMAHVLLVILLSSSEYTLTFPEQMCHARAVTEDHFHFSLFCRGLFPQILGCVIYRHANEKKRNRSTVVE